MSQVGLSSGNIFEYSRLGLATEPRVYFASHDGMRSCISRESSESRETTPGVVLSCAVGLSATCLQFSPFISDIFLVGQLDGGCRLHRLSYPTPLRSWPMIESNASKGTSGLMSMAKVSDLAWSSQRPSVFFLLHDNGDLHIFDLNDESNMPAHSFALTQHLDVRGDNFQPKLAISSGSALASKLLTVSLGGSVFTRTLSETVTKPKESELAILQRKLRVMTQL